MKQRETVLLVSSIYRGNTRCRLLFRILWSVHPSAVKSHNVWLRFSGRNQICGALAATLATSSAAPQRLGPIPSDRGSSFGGWATQRILHLLNFFFFIIFTFPPEKRAGKVTQPPTGPEHLPKRESSKEGGEGRGELSRWGSRRSVGLLLGGSEMERRRRPASVPTMRLSKLLLFFF